MGTPKRERQKELHRSRMEEARKQAEKDALRSRAVGGGILAGIVVLVIGAFIWLGGDDSSDAADEDTQTSTTQPADSVIVGPGAGASIVGDTPCPAVDGSEERTTSFENAPPDCLTEGASYAAEFATSKGNFTVELDAEAAPITVNNFVVLSRYGYYDGIPFHRVVPDFVIQAGDPSDVPTGAGGPGYTIEEEPPADGVYEKYDLAMAKTSEPSSTGSQFFVVTGSPAALNSDGSYSLFGSVVAGQEVVDELGLTEVEGDRPTELVTIDKITILEG